MSGEDWSYVVLSLLGLAMSWLAYVAGTKITPTSRPKPDLGDPEYLAYAELFNDITRAPRWTDAWFPFSTRQAVAFHLWSLGYRKMG